ncbi:hypothetical protein [Neisseria meningitidis]|uniref:hypothetical protein n=1 Tax=Neisseria meningitidis TaxID=487 RepID=UPI000A997149|nr:hypothetical protein [Neisseria meningitidis]
MRGKWWAGCFNIVGRCGGGDFKKQVYGKCKGKAARMTEFQTASARFLPGKTATAPRHSRAGGNPDFDLLEMFKVNRYFKLPDSCFRGNGDMTVFNFNLL